jgi:hypothetical protein
MPIGNTTLPNLATRNRTISISSAGLIVSGSVIISGSANTITLSGASTTESPATQTYVTGQIGNLVDSAPTALDTLNELAAAIGDDANYASTISTALGNRLRVDTASQGLDSTQKSNARTNLGLGTAATYDVGDFATAVSVVKLTGDQSIGGFKSFTSGATTWDKASGGSILYFQQNGVQNANLNFNSTYSQFTSFATNGFLFNGNIGGVSSNLLILDQNGALTTSGKITLGTFANSTTNTGEAWIGRASDRNAGTMTVQLGGNSVSNRYFEVVDYAWTTVLFSTTSGGDSTAASSLRAPIFYDSDDTNHYIDPNGSSNIVNISADRYYQKANGVPSNNLGDPTVTEMALFDSQFNNKTAFYNPSLLKFYTSTNGSTWTEYTSFSTGDKKAFLGGDGTSGVNIPYNTPYFAIEVSAVNYVFLNALYMYWSSNGHSSTVKTQIRRVDNSTWYDHTTSNAGVSSWPGHLYLPFGTVPFLEGPSSSTGHYDKIRFIFQPSWNSSYSSNAINLYNFQVWGGYPAGKRNVYYTDSDANVTFPGDLRATLFYDANDTGYYTDPASTSDSAQRIKGGTLHGPNVDWNKYLLVGGNGRQNYINNADVASVCTTDGNLHIDAASGKSLYLNYYDGDVIYLGGGANNIIASINSDGSFRPQLIYDYNNTVYYVDPNGATSLNIAGQITTAKTNGTLLSIAGADTFGLNDTSGLGVYIKGTGNTYIYGGGKFFDGSSVRTLWHSGDFSSTNVSNWNTAYGWGNHASAGYLTSYTETDTLASVTGRGATTSTAITLSNSLTLAGFGANSFMNGTGDGQSFSTYNFALSGWASMAFYNPTAGGSFPNQVSGLIDFRNGSINMRGDFRAPLFYDLDNTLYYLDAASTSNIVGLTVANTITGNISGNAATATSAATWTTGRTITIGSTGKSVNGSGDVSWTLSEIGAATAAQGAKADTAHGWGNHASAGYLTSVTNIGGYASTLYREDNRTISPAELTAGNVNFGFTSWANNDSSPYADFLHLRSYTDSSGGSDNLIMFKKSGIGMRIWQQTYGSSTAYSSYVDVWTSGDFSSTNVSNWNTAYGWGNHASAGYLTSVTNISGNAATATTAVNLSGLGVIQSTSTGTSYQNNYQIRENSGGSGNTSETYAPQLAFHWAGVVASSIMIEPSGRIAIRNNPGSGYENFVASEVYAQTFIDLNDTNYYINPSGTSNIVGLTVANTITGNAASATNAKLVDCLSNRTDSAAYQVAWVAPNQGTNPNTGNSSTYAFSCAAVTIQSSTGTLSATNLAASTRVDSPIFYDSNDTNYYLNPASTSILGNARANNHSTLAGDGYGYGFWQGYGGSDYSIWMSESGNGTYGGQVSGVGSGNDYNMYFRMKHNNRGFVFITGDNTPKVQIANEGLHVDGDIYADKFYDRNDTSYYVDPKGQSLLASLATREATVGGLTTPDPCAVLDVQSTTQGFLPPRMSDVEMAAIASPVPGLIVWNNDGPVLQVFDGSSWRKLAFA